MADYKLRVEGATEEQKKSIAEVIAYKMPLESVDGGDTYDGWSYFWDDDADMKDLSLAFPEVLFALHGYGECVGDYWVDYYKGGKVQHGSAWIEYEEFDEKKLR